MSKIKKEDEKREVPVLTFKEYHKILTERRALPPNYKLQKKIRINFLNTSRSRRGEIHYDKLSDKAQLQIKLGLGKIAC